MLPENRTEGGSDVATQQASSGDGGAVSTVAPPAPESLSKPDRPSTTDLLKGLADDATTLVRQEVLLAKQEVTEGLTSTAKASILLVVAGVLALYGFGFLLGSASGAVGGPAWRGPLIVGGGLAIIAAILALAGRSRLKKSKVGPTKATAELKQTANGLKEEISGRNRGGNDSRDRTDSPAHGGQSGQTL